MIINEGGDYNLIIIIKTPAFKASINMNYEFLKD